jgi:hypothetical protein
VVVGVVVVVDSMQVSHVNGHSFSKIAFTPGKTELQRSGVSAQAAGSATPLHALVVVVVVVMVVVVVVDEVQTPHILGHSDCTKLPKIGRVQSATAKLLPHSTGSKIPLHACGVVAVKVSVLVGVEVAVVV